MLEQLSYKAFKYGGIYRTTEDTRQNGPITLTLFRTWMLVNPWIWGLWLAERDPNSIPDMFVGNWCNG